ncbi:DAD family-domain-containing protein [Mrakia frigida]|uniref:dolichyl-diphosphooligosaccharide-protein glycotransferase n=1 Tax=Mrakia frigida TaxID=29902 RepID=UPI003FCC1698
MAPPTSLSQLKKAAVSASASASTNPSPSPSSSVATNSPSSAASSALSTLIHSYKTTTPDKIKLIDSFLLFLLISGVAQFGYCVLVTSFPYNAFLGAFASSAGQFILLAGLRAQVASPALPSTTTSTSTSPSGTKISLTTAEPEFKEVSKERAFADFCFASVILHFFVFNFLG